MTQSSDYTHTDSRLRTPIYGEALLGPVMLLVAAAIGFTAVGTFVGRNLSPGTGLALSLGALGMLIVQALGGRTFRIGGFAVAWLFAVGLVIGLGLGPPLGAYAAADPGVIARAAVSTALVVAAMGAGGLALNSDLARWLRPLPF